MKYTHEDEEPDMVMEAQTVEQLEDYEGELLFEDEDDSDDVQFGKIDSRLCKPRVDDVEPQISVSELTQLDVLADEVEIRRLCKLNVLLKPATLDGVEHVVELSTRMVRTWREKEHAGQPVWIVDRVMPLEDTRGFLRGRICILLLVQLVATS